MLSHRGGIAVEGDFVRVEVVPYPPPNLRYQWRRNGVPVPGRVDYRLVVSAATLADSGIYDVVGNNGGGSATSAPVSLTVVANLPNPRVIGMESLADNISVHLHFDRELDPATAQDVGNYALTRSNGDSLPVLSAKLNASRGRLVIVTTEPRLSGESFSIRVGGVRDATAEGNLLTPNPTVWSEVLPVSAEWRYLQDDVPQSGDWFSTGFDDSGWSVGRGIFGVELDLEHLIETPLWLSYTNVETGVVNEWPTTTYYFRSHFDAGAHDPGKRLYLTGRYDDGFTVYVNGSEAVRDGLLLNRSEHTAEAVHHELSYRHESDVIEMFPIDASLLLPGDNVIAAELHQNQLFGSDAVWGVSLFSMEGRKPPGTLSVLLNQDGTASVSWSGGELLVADTVDGPYRSSGETNSPFTIPVAAGNQFFRTSSPVP